MVKKTALSKKGAKTAKKKILVVDDEKDFCNILSRNLNMKGFRVDTAHDGREALRAVKMKKPDLIMLDERMPIMGGFEFLKKMRSQTRTSYIPIIMLTARTKSQDVGRGIDLGVDFYLPKPFDFGNLIKFINVIFKR